MRDVYGNSLCNLAATAASNADESMFNNRDASLVQTCHVDLAWKEVSGTQCALIGDDIWFTSVTSAPLNKRCWIVQEPLLAPRVLHFGREQLLWECHELDACETFPLGLPPVFSGTYGPRFKGLDPDIDGERLRKRIKSHRVPSELKDYMLWDRILKSYMSCSLTNEEDKLIAISGIARDMQIIIGDEYVAGLWRHILP
jgi:hypothetical protein